MAQGLAAVVQQKVLFRHVGDVFRLVILGKQVIVRLILARTNVFRNCLPPFLGVREFRVDVEHEAPKRIEAVLYDIADLESGGSHFSILARHRM